MMKAMFHGPALCLLSLWSAGATNAQQIQGFEFEVTTLGGQKLSSAQLTGNVLLVDYWGTWCPPCREAIPVLEGLYRKYKHYGLEIVGLSYESAATPEAAAEKVRTFAGKHGITYPLALGTPQLQAKVPGFSGYPTILMFDRQLAHRETIVGFSPAEGRKLEEFVRRALGLAQEDAPERESVVDPDAEPAEEVVEAQPEVRELPAGVIFKPGDGDRGFTFTATDADDKEFDFAQLRGKPVLLALTSTWDGEARKTAAFLQGLHTRFGAQVQVLAASMEIPKQEAAKLAKIREFRDELQLGYRLFPAGLGLSKKVHLYSGMPTYLLFDAEGVLIRRDDGNSEQKLTELEQQVAGLAGG